jgi:hypothetical protein
VNGPLSNTVTGKFKVDIELGAVIRSDKNALNKVSSNRALQSQSHGNLLRVLKSAFLTKMSIDIPGLIAGEVHATVWQQ